MILLTGASGFLGSALARAFGDQVLTVGRMPDSVASNQHITCDLVNADCSDRIVTKTKQQNITHLIHAAGVTPWSKSPDFSLDLKMANTITKLCHRLAIPNLYFFSGWIVYDTRAKTPFTETTIIATETPYGQSKVAVEEYFRQNLIDTKLINLRLASVYGPGQTSPGLIPNLVVNALKQKHMTLKSLKTRRDYLYIDDFVKAIRRLLYINLGENLNLNIGSGTSISVFEVADAIKAICKELYKYDIKVDVDPAAQEADLLDNRLSIKRAQDMGLLMQTEPFKKGLETYISWVKNENIL